MKLKFIQLTLLVSLLFSAFSLQAQFDESPNLKGTLCVGDICDNQSNLFVLTEPCDNLGVFHLYSLNVDASNLCPNTSAVFTVTDCNGAYYTYVVTGGDLPLAFPIEVPCDCSIEINVTLINNGAPISCKRLGYVTADLILLY